MIRVDEIVAGGDTDSIVAILILTDDSGTGIRRVIVRDRFGMEIPLSEQPKDCPTPSWETTLGTIFRDRLPLAVEAVDCVDNTTPAEAIGPLFAKEARIPLPEPDPISPPRCSAVLCPPTTRTCDEAMASVLLAHDALLPRCGVCEALARAADAKLAEAIAWGVAAFVALVLAATLGQSGGLWGAIFALVFGVLTAVFVALANAAYAEEAQLRSEAAACLREREPLQARFAEALGAVAENCCPGCGGVIPPQPC